MVIVKKSPTVIISTQCLDETVGGGLHVDEVAAEGAGAVKHEHDHRALVLVDGLRIARRRKFTVVLPLRCRLQPVPLFHIVGADLRTVQVGEVLEQEQVEDAFG